MSQPIAFRIQYQQKASDKAWKRIHHKVVHIPL